MLDGAENVCGAEANSLWRFDDQLLDESSGALTTSSERGWLRDGQVEGSALLNGGDRRERQYCREGFGLTGLCIGESADTQGGGDPWNGCGRRCASQDAIAQRTWVFYHSSTWIGERMWNSSSRRFDTSLLACGADGRQHFMTRDPRLATAIYEARRLRGC